MGASGPRQIRSESSKSFGRRMKSPSVGPEERRHHPHQLQLMFDEYFPFWRLVFLFALASLVSAWMDGWWLQWQHPAVTGCHIRPYLDRNPLGFTCCFLPLYYRTIRRRSRWLGRINHLGENASETQWRETLLKEGPAATLPSLSHHRGRRRRPCSNRKRFRTHCIACWLKHEINNPLGST